MNKKALTILACMLAADISIPPAQADVRNGSSCTVPLVLTTIKDASGNPEYKLGVYVGLGGGAPMLYEFDTGGQGFWAAYTKRPPASQGQWWGRYTITKGVKLANHYSSGNDYHAKLANTVVALYASTPTGFAKQCESSPIGLAQIDKFTNKKSPGAAKAWKKALATGQPPLFGAFYGDFGAGLSPVYSKNRKKTAIYSALPQFFGSKASNGFIVHVGPLATASPSLTLGIDGADRSSFPIVLPMNPYCKTGGKASACIPCAVVFPNSQACAYSQQVTNADIGWALSGGAAQSFDGIGLTLDTGAPSATISQSPAISVQQTFINSPTRSHGYWTGEFTPGVTLTLNATGSGAAPLDYSVTTGSSKSIDKVSASVHSKSDSSGGVKAAGYLNTGLMLYTAYDVMFDLEYGVVRLKPLAN